MIDYIDDQLPASEEIAAALRTTTHAYPKKAVREIVGNAIVHQDLTERGTGITVEIYDDRIEVTNPGTSRETSGSPTCCGSSISARSAVTG